MGGNIFLRQFQVKNFGFECTNAERERFFTTQWTKSRLVFLIYRWVLALYCSGWTVAFYVESSMEDPYYLEFSYTYLTAWSAVMVTSYFLAAALLSTVGYIQQKNFCLEKETCSMKWLRSATWMLHTIAADVSLIVCVVYWTWVRPYGSSDPFIIHRHGVNALLVFLDMFIVAFPHRICHFVYSSIFGIFHLICSVLFHRVGIYNKLYDLLDWHNSPWFVLGFGSLIVLLCCCAVHWLYFGIYCLRTWLFQKCCKASVVYSPVSSVRTVSDKKSLM